MTDAALQEAEHLRRAQRARARAAALAAKAEQRKVREGLVSGDIDPLKLIRGELDEWEPAAKRLRLRVVIRAVPGIANARYMDVMRVFDANPDLRLGQFTYARREQLADLVNVARHGNI